MGGRAVLLVEGNDDKHVLLSLLQRYCVPECFAIKDKGGIENLLDTLDVELMASDLERLGIVVDADADLGARWARLRGILTARGYSVPRAPEPTGTIIEQQGKVTVGIWVMPENTLPGMLEDFAAFLVPPGDALWTRACRSIDAIPESERRFALQHRCKAHIHTWLAWQRDPGTPLGLAITKRYLDGNAEQARLLMEWCRHVFCER